MNRIPVRIPAALLLLSLAAVPPAVARRAAPRPAPFAAPAALAPAAFAPAFLPSSLPSLSAAEELAISRSTAGLVTFRLANGALGLDLQGRFQEFAVASVGPDGRLVVHCVDDAGALRRLLGTPFAAAPTPVTPVLEDR